MLFGQFNPLQPLLNLFAISLLYHWSGVFAQVFLLLFDGVYLKVVPVPNNPPPEEPPPLPPPPPPPPPVDGGVGAGAAAGAAGGGAAASINHFLKFKFM
jgi:hypothetical protein